MLSKRNTGFSLTEFLVVIAIVVTISGVSALSLKGGAGARLATSGSKIASFIESARASAILNRQPVAVALLAAGREANRAFVALGYTPPASLGTTGQWTQLSRWELLPEGVTVDVGLDSGGNPLAGLLPSASPVVVPPLPALTRGGQTYGPGNADGYGYVVFMPDGSLYHGAGGAPPTRVLRMVEGVWQSGGIVYTGGKDADGLAANYFELSLNPTTGTAKIVRPEL